MSRDKNGKFVKGNTEGSKTAMPPENKCIKMASKEHIVKVVGYVTKSPNVLEEIINTNKGTMLENIMWHAYMKKDYTIFKDLFDRSLGKAKETHQVNMSGHAAVMEMLQNLENEE